MSKPVRVLCLGGGYVAIYLCRALRGAIRSGAVEVTVVSRDNYHTFHGLVAEMLTGRIQPGAIVSPARRVFRPARFHNAEIAAIDLAAQTVTTSRSLDGREYTLQYDHLVIALGSVDDLSRYRGVAEHTLKLKTYADCFRARNHVLTMLELAEIEEQAVERRRLLTFVIAGGGYAGVEVATELEDYFRLLARKDYPRIDPEEVRVVVVHSGPSLLPELGAHHPRLARAAERFVKERTAVELRLETRLAAATPEEAVLSTGERIPTRTIISATGAAQSPLLDTLPFPRDERGRVLTDASCRVRGTVNVWAAGDCAAVPHPKGATVPMLATYAMYEGRQIGKNILRLLEGQQPRRYGFTGLGDAASLGHRYAVGHIKGIELTGSACWLLWRLTLFYYLPTWDRRLRVLWDWLIWPVVGRDIAALKVGERTGVRHEVFESGQVIVRQGDVGRRLYVIRSGEVEVVREQPEGETLLAVLGPGEHFGETAVFESVKRTATVRARSATEVLALERDEVLDLSRSVAPIGGHLRRRPGTDGDEQDQ